MASGSRETVESGGRAVQDVSLLGGTLEMASVGLADYVDFGGSGGLNSGGTNVEWRQRRQ